MLALAMLALAGCQTDESTHPDFIARTEQDCLAGDGTACRMLSSLVPDAPADPTPVMRRSNPTKVQQDLAAMLRGVERARAMARLKALARTQPSIEQLLRSPPPVPAPRPDVPASDPQP
jgi:hypothetical protein